MDIKIKKFTIILLAAMLPIILNCCGKNNNYKIKKHVGFLYPISITPIKDTINVGDTLWINVDISDSLYDIGTQKKYYVPNCNFKDYFSVERLIDKTKTIAEQEYAADKFNTYSTIGNISIGGAFAIDFIPIYENNRYRLSGALIAKDTGVFAVRAQNLSFEEPIPQIDLGKDEDGHQLLAIFGFTAYNINNGNTHYNIFRQHCKPENNYNPVEWTEDKFAYTFVVK